ncbi:MAG: hypothetical protein ACE3L7_00305 [Candidatus Pristimantibacillus sp.]
MRSQTVESVHNDFMYFSPAALENALKQYLDSYGDDYLDRLAILEQLIFTANSGFGKFNVFNLEAGLGKSVFTNTILHNYIRANIIFRRNMLIVKPFSTDVEETAEAISGKYYDNMVLGITANNWKTEWSSKSDKLSEYCILIITHQRYKDLCSRPRLREKFTQGRHTMIIDERINFDVSGFDENIFLDAHKAFGTWRISVKLDMVTNPLKSIVEKNRDEVNSNNRCISYDPTIDKHIYSDFREKVLQYRDVIQDNDKIKKFNTALRLLYTNKGLYYGNRISTTNPTERLWGLRNNVILDANGSFDMSYKSNNYHPLYLEDIVDHSGSKIHWVRFNSSRYKIRNRPEYFDIIVFQILMRKRNSDKVLLVIQKEFVKKLYDKMRELGISRSDICFNDIYSDEQFVIEHFGNLIGKNYFGDFTQVWVLGTPNLHMENYVLLWNKYTGLSYEGKDLTTKVQETLRFNDPELEQFRHNYLLGEYYQSIKRIQRNPFPKAEYYIVNKAEDLFLDIAAQLKNVQHGGLILLPLEETTIETDEIRLYNHIMSLEPGTYKKRELRQAIGSNQDFGRLACTTSIRYLFSTGKISIHSNNRKIIIN